MKNKVFQILTILGILLISSFICSFLFTDMNFITLKNVEYTIFGLFHKIIGNLSSNIFSMPGNIIITSIIMAFVICSIYFKKVATAIKIIVYIATIVCALLLLVDLNLTTGILLITISFIALSVLYTVYAKIFIKKQYLIKSIPMIGALIIVVISCIIFSIIKQEATFNDFAYLKNNELIYVDGDEKITLTKKFFNDEESEDNIAISYVLYNDNKVVFFDNIKRVDDDITANLNIYDDGESIIIEKDIYSMKYTNNGEIIAYVKDDNLYLYKDEETLKIVSEVLSYSLSQDGTNILFIDSENRLYLYDIAKKEKNKLADNVDSIDDYAFNQDNAIIYEKEDSVYDNIIGKIDSNIQTYNYTKNGLFYIKKSNDQSNLYVYKDRNRTLLKRDIVSVDGYYDDGKYLVYHDAKSYYLLYNGEKSSFIGKTSEIESVRVNDLGNKLYFIKNIKIDDESTTELVRYELSKEKLLNRKQIDSNVYDYTINEDSCYYMTDYDPLNYTSTLFECSSKKLLTTTYNTSTFLDQQFIYMTDIDEEENTLNYHIFKDGSGVLLSNSIIASVSYNDQSIMYINNYNDDSKRGDLISYNISTGETKKVENLVTEVIYIFH